MGDVPLRRIATAFAATLALHALVLWWVVAPRVRTAWTHALGPVMSTRWLAAPALPGEVQVQEAAPRPVTRARATARGGRPAAAPADEAAAPLSDPLPVQSELPPTPEPAWRVDGIQRAARESARRKGLAELADEQLGQRPASADAALREGMASAARSDCLKGGEGGYANAGLGLLALPLLAADLAAGRCR
jgi:hypothetical protein